MPKAFITAMNAQKPLIIYGQDQAARRCCQSSQSIEHHARGRAASPPSAFLDTLTPERTIESRADGRAGRVLEMRGITKRFPGVLANDHVDFELRRGEVHALLGENGAGKSTLMSILYGLYHPDEGQILLNGNEVVRSTRRERRSTSASAWSTSTSC